MIHFPISVKEMYAKILRYKFRPVMLYYKITDIYMRFLQIQASPTLYDSAV